MAHRPTSFFCVPFWWNVAAEVALFGLSPHFKAHVWPQNIFFVFPFSFLVESPKKTKTGETDRSCERGLDMFHDGGR